MPKFARFVIQPSSPLLEGVALTFDRAPLKDAEPIETDEHGGFHAELPKLFLDKSAVRKPGLVRFLPSRWPFTGVAFAEAARVELEDSPSLVFRQGKLRVTGWADYTVQTEDGEQDKAHLPIEGVFVRMYPALEAKLEELQNPQEGQGGGNDRVKLLRELLGRVGDWGKDLVEEALADLQAGKTLDAETLKGIRYRMHRSDMSEDTGMFKGAGSPLGMQRDYGSKTAGMARRVALRYAARHK